MNDSHTLIHLDLSNLRENSMGDEEFIQDMIQLFITRGAEKIDQLATETTDGPNENWVAYAHALKGMAANIGALHLREICATAQSMADANTTARKDMVQKLHTEYQIVLDEFKKPN